MSSSEKAARRMVDSIEKWDPLPHPGVTYFQTAGPGGPRSMANGGAIIKNLLLCTITDSHGYAQESWLR